MNEEIEKSKIRNENPFTKDGNEYTDSDRISAAELANTWPKPSKDDINLMLLETKLRKQAIKFFSNKELLKEYPALIGFGDTLLDNKILHKILIKYLQQQRIYKLPSISQSISDITNLGFTVRKYIDNSNIETAITKSLEQIYQYHIKYYVQIFTELDERLIKNPNSQEVYLGRDAMFMYQARKAQFIAQGLPTNNLVYINYPTNFIGYRTSLTKTDKLTYLKDNNIINIDNVVFIDTGVSGSIPQDIMSNLFNIKDADYINDRILLIKSKVAGRRGKYITDNASIYSTESSPKPEHTALGLYKHKSGKIKTYAMQKDVTKILQYDLLRHVIMRHFYLDGLYKKEKFGRSSD